MKKVIFCSMLLVLTSFARELPIEYKRLSFGLQAGSGDLPMKEWSNFWDGMGAHVEKGNDQVNIEAFLKYHFGRSVYKYSLEHVSMSSKGIWNDMDYIDWKFKSTSTALAYEYHPMDYKSRISPYVGVGAAIYFSQVDATQYEMVSQNPETYSEYSTDTRRGRGYGTQLYYGVKLNISPKMSIIAQLRNSWANGMGFTDGDGDIEISLDGTDWKLGVEIAFCN